MSIEFTADVTGREDCVVSVVDTLRTDRDLEMLGPLEHGIARFRFVNCPARDGWSEDLTLALRPGKIVIAFHSASRENRERIIRLLEMVLRRSGCSGAFVEE